jgi:hypothetical protein
MIHRLDLNARQGVPATNARWNLEHKVAAKCHQSVSDLITKWDAPANDPFVDTV